MNSFFSMFCILLALAGCQSNQDKAYEAQQATAPKLKSKLQLISKDSGILSYAADGRRFLVANYYDEVEVYTARNMVPVVSFPWLMSTNQGGAGFIDSDIVYYSGKREIDKRVNYGVSLWSLKSEKIIYSYNFKVGAYGDDPVLANANYVAHGDEMINWHTGGKYLVRTAHVMPLDYALTASGRVLSSNYYSGEILLHSPLTDTSLLWGSGLSNFRTAITHSERYVIAQAGNGECRVWLVPELKSVQSCGRSNWSNANYIRVVPHPVDDSFAVSVGRRVEVYRITGGSHQRVFSRILPNEVSALTLSTNYRVAMTDSTGHIEVWDTEKSTLLGQADLQLPFGDKLLLFSPSGKQILYGEGNATVHLFDISD